MILQKNNVFALCGSKTCYLFHVLESGQLEHLYYGNRIEGLTEDNLKSVMTVMSYKCEFLPGNMSAYSQEYKNLSLEYVCQEMSSVGKGDMREPFVYLVYADGSRTSDFVYETFLIQGKQELVTLPSSYGTEQEELVIFLKERSRDVTLELHYSLFEDSDVLTRSCVVKNKGSENLQVLRLMSQQLDLQDCQWQLTNFSGAWLREMNPNRHTLSSGKFVNASRAGVSGSGCNPFVMIGRENTVEESGECMGFNLVYSGNHYLAAEAGRDGGLRIVQGINPEGFSYELKAGEALESPEAVLTYTKEGYGQMSRNMHDFVREHIVRGVWKKKERPVLLNSWEAAYFQFDENKLLKMAKSAADVGIELFVMDDGWFGKRNDDTSSLGDWFVDRKKLPGGLKGLQDKLKQLGLAFGIWVEPEMVNEDSALYRTHPDWAMQIPGREQSLGRNQMILDLVREEVQEYIIDSMTKVFESADISYVKWDMNRNFTDCFCSALVPDRQGEVSHRYVMGLYRVMKELTARFPDILFEGCASGGNRFDLGILCYMPQIWGSDDTDAYARAAIQTGYSYGYPLSCVSAHVSGCPNHQTLRNTPLSTRFHVAAYGVLGYECNLAECKKEETEEIKRQIAFYKENRAAFQFGDFYRICSGEDTPQTRGAYQWNVVSKDKKNAFFFHLYGAVVPNHMNDLYKIPGLDETKTYHVCNRGGKINVKEFGDLINTVAPIHVKKDSLTHNLIAKMVQLDIEKEDFAAPGSVLVQAGFHPKQNYTGTGYNENVRFLGDFRSRLYSVEADPQV